MTFNPDSSKQVQEVIISRKTKKTSYAPLNFNNNTVQQVQFQKYLSVYLDGKSDFREHLQNMFKKINKTISLLSKLQNKLPRAPLVTIYKSFEGCIWIMETFYMIRLFSAVAITGTIRGSSREKRYQELGFEP